MAATRVALSSAMRRLPLCRFDHSFVCSPHTLLAQPRSPVPTTSRSLTQTETLLEVPRSPTPSTASRTLSLLPTLAHSSSSPVATVSTCMLLPTLTTMQARPSASTSTSPLVLLSTRSVTLMQDRRDCADQSSKLVHASNLYHNNEWSGELADRMVNLTHQHGGMGFKKGEKPQKAGTAGLKVSWPTLEPRPTRLPSNLLGRQPRPKEVTRRLDWSASRTLSTVGPWVPLL